MSATTSFQPWTLDEFFLWQEAQETRYELVDGFPLKMMTGASNRHDQIVINILAELRGRLRGKPCRPFSADGAVETRPNQIRRPDAGVDCGRADPNGYLAAEPTIVFEVLSPSTRDFDRLRKIGEYKEMLSLRHIALLEQDKPLATLWSRFNKADWTEQQIEGLDTSLVLPAVGIELPMTAIYEDVLFGG